MRVKIRCMITAIGAVTADHVPRNETKLKKLLPAVTLVLLFMEAEAIEPPPTTSINFNVEENVDTRAPVKLNITVIPMPEGYQDSKNWTSESVLDLLRLINGTEAAAVVNDALDISKTSQACENSTLVDDVMFNITNYKEAKLAGALISGAQLKKIMQDRARYNRDLESTTEDDSVVTVLKDRKGGKGNGAGSDEREGSQNRSGDGHTVVTEKPERSGDVELLVPDVVKKGVGAGVVKG